MAAHLRRSSRTGRQPAQFRLFAAHGTQLWIIILGLALSVLSGAALAQGGAVRHFRSAEIAVAPQSAYDNPQTLLLPGATPTTWRPVALPHLIKRAVVQDQGLVSAWYRIRYGPRTSDKALFLYIPRWQVTGKLAIYADRRLVFAPRSGPLWISFNTPVWVKLADPGAPAPQEILIRTVSLKRDGGGLSTVWIGEEDKIGLRHAVRRWLQDTLTAILSFGAAVFGCSALVIWTWRRRESAFLFLGLAAVFDIIWEFQFQISEAPLPMPEIWFGWLMTCALQWWILSAYLFSLRIIGTDFRRLEAGLVIFTALFTALTAPFLQGGAALIPPTYAPLADGMTLLFVFVITASLWVAYFKKPSHEGLAVCAFITLGPIAGYHDVLLHNYVISIESIYLSPIATSLLLIAMIYIMLRRYILAMAEADRYAARLEGRVREREAELEVSYARLREVERRQTVTMERQRLMRDMHDGIGSSLMGALAVVERGRLSEVDVAQMLRDCIDDLKLTIDSLEPVDNDLPLVLATVRYRLGPRFEQAGIALDWRVEETPPLGWLDSERALHVLRIVQEIFSNIVKHAAASRVSVAMRLQDQAVLLVVEDDGVGFLADAPLRQGARGLINLRQRAKAIGAVIVWTSRPGATRFELSLPLTL